MSIYLVVVCSFFGGRASHVDTTFAIIFSFLFIAYIIDFVKIRKKLDT